METNNKGLIGRIRSLGWGFAAMLFEEVDVAAAGEGIGLDGARRGAPLLGQVLKPERQRLAGGVHRTGHRSAVRSTTRASSSA